MATYQELKAELELVEREMEAARKRESGAALQEILERIKQYGLTIHDLENETESPPSTEGQIIQLQDAMPSRAVTPCHRNRAHKRS